MNRIGDLIINLLSAAIGFGVARLTAAIRRALKIRRARRFWRPFVDGKLYLVFPAFDQVRHTAWDPSGIAGIGDVIALRELEEHLQSIRLRHYDIEYAHLMRGEQLKSNLVLIAGPDANRISRMAMEKLPLTFTFHDNGVTILDRINKKSYEPIGRKEGALTTDLGLIIRASNPFDSTRQILIVAGSYGFGTAAAAALAITSTFLKKYAVQRGGSYEVLFTVDVVDSVAQEPIIKEFRKLNTTP